jgi:hypothetical protein
MYRKVRDDAAERIRQAAMAHKERGEGEMTRD